MAVSDEVLRAGGTSPLLLLDATDNVFVVRKRIRAGEVFRGEAHLVTAPHDLSLGHKVARRAIATGEKILKYGAPIGVATQDIPPGAHVHVHNVRSDYTPTHHLIDAQKSAAS